MIINIADNNYFKKVFGNQKFDLPIRWDGNDFVYSLQCLYKEYVFNLCCQQGEDCHLFALLQDDTHFTSRLKKCYQEKNCLVLKVRKICDDIIDVLKEYLKGFPDSAYKKFDKIMNTLIHTPIKIYPKSGWTDAFNGVDPLKLFRVVNVAENINHPKTRIFHTPYNLRTKIGTNRYSIAGFPCLYLGTSLKLCLEELHSNPYEKYSISSRFQMERDMFKHDIQIDVLELGIKPQDFFENREDDEFALRNRKVDGDLLQDNKVRKAYLLWYPIIAASSFIRANKNDPFAPEYIIPQLLMQWIRKWSSNNPDKLLGIRYFSCSSQRASDLGFNYVFPTSGEAHEKSNNYCKILVNSFKVSNPVFVHEFDEIEECEYYLKSIASNELKYIYE